MAMDFDVLSRLRATWPQTTLQISGREIEVVRTAGAAAGPPVFWLPGAQGTAESWCHQLLAFGRRRAMTAVNYPADAPPQDLADLIVSVADEMEVSSFDLVGSSLGGYLAQWVAVRHPQRVRRIVLGNTFADPTPAQTVDKLAALERRPASALHEEVVARLGALPEGEFKALQLELVGRCLTPALMRDRMIAVQRATPLPSLGVTDRQVLIIECDDDPLIQPPMRAALRAAHPDSLSVVIEGGGHYPSMLRVEAYNRAVAAFLDL